MICTLKMWLIILFFGLVDSIVYPKEKCDMDDCSLQIHPFQNRSCLIHRTTVCLHSLSNFTQTSETELKYEDNAKFFFSIAPYSAEVYVHPVTLNLSAINITFVINKNGVNALAVKIASRNNTLCRIFDFRGLGSHFNLPVNLYYDCLYYLAESQYQYVQLDMILLPMNEKLSYFVYIPTSRSLKIPCDWQPVIMVFSGRLVDGIVKVRFSHAPQRFNISFYSVTLTEKSTKKQISIRVSSDEKEDMLSAKFSSVNYGNYSINVKPLIEGKNSCPGAEMGIFQVGNSKPVLDKITVICICISIFFTICSLLFYKCCGHSIKLKFFRKRILLVFSHDYHHHAQFASAVVDYLTQKCHFVVNTIFGDKGTPQKWAEDKYEEADVVIFLISEGLLRTLDEEAPRKVEALHHWTTQLLDASNYIFHKFYYEGGFKIKKICKICFPYASRLPIPKSFDNKTGKCFMLPKNINRLLCFIHDCRPMASCTNRHQHSCNDLNSSEEGEMLLKKLAAVQVQVDNDVHPTYVDESVKNVDINTEESVNLHVLENNSISVEEDAESQLLSNQALMDTIGVHLPVLERRNSSSHSEESSESSNTGYSSQASSVSELNEEDTECESSSLLDDKSDADEDVRNCRAFIRDIKYLEHTI